MFVDGGRIPPGFVEVRKASMIINYEAQDDRSITQKDLELLITHRLEF